MAELVVNGYMTDPVAPATTQTQTNPTNWQLVTTPNTNIYVFKTTSTNILTTQPPPTGITQCVGLDMINNLGNTGIKQTITFPTLGNYILTFWFIKRTGYSVSDPSTLRVQLGSSVDITYNKNDTVWEKKTISFANTVLNPVLTFSSTAPNTSATSMIILSGVSIVVDTTIPPPCFREGTLISCSLNGVDTEVPIENLKEFPYLVKTLKHGFLPIHSIGKSLLHNPGNRDRIKTRLYKLTQLNYPEIYKPLYLTGCHGILVPSLTEQEKKVCQEQYEGKVFVTDGHYRLFACLDERAEPFAEEGEFPIYHVALQSEDTLVNYGIYANGLLVESCSIWSLTEKHKHVEHFQSQLLR